MSRKLDFCPPPPEVADLVEPAEARRTLFRWPHLVAVAVAVGLLAIWLIARR